tara:strand:+ start:1816 stop:2049 length:234 start_codon:yes stop_codon:yes gene_type:complete
MTLKELALAISAIPIEVLTRDVHTPGTRSFVLAEFIGSYFQHMRDAELHHNLVGVGCITYAENQLDAENQLSTSVLG